MKNKKKTHKKYKVTYIITTVVTLFVCLLFVRGYTPFEKTGENLFHVRVNGQEVGILNRGDNVEEMLIQARRNVASTSDELLFMEAELEIWGEEALRGSADDEETVISRMEEALRASIRPSMHRSYTVKINENILNLASVQEVRDLLQVAIDKYAAEGEFSVEMIQDTERAFNILTARVVKTTEEGNTSVSNSAGIQGFLDSVAENVESGKEKEFEDYDLGIRSMTFSEKIEVVENYLPENQLMSLEEAVNLVVMEQEMPSYYEVVSGDTLTEIAIKVNIPMDKIVEMNDSLESIDTIINVGDKLLITVPEPELSVNWVEEKYYEEIYDADVIYIDNDNWYTNHVVVRQEPSSGFRRVVAEVSYVNDKEVSRVILKEEIAMQAVAKIVERGTQVPPTYIKPLQGGRVTSTFGNRPQPVPGASTNHQAIDWATATGTPIYASSGGTVARAGWIGSYGNVIYINHPDGRQTRYAHLSRILVTPGQKVKQGETIALSGNTGVTSGPHVHFEMIIDGVKVDPFKYGVPR